MGELANPGSTIGEAIGHLMEAEMHRILAPIAQERGYIYVSTGPVNKRTKRPAKLVLVDDDGIQYELDAVIMNSRFQPLILLESKYIRYKKHNRDKASWICTAHTRLRRRFISVRKSIAILMGSWSSPSKQLLRSFEVDILEIPFANVVAALAKYGIVFDWAEKDKDTAMLSAQAFRSLSLEHLRAIALELLDTIQSDLIEAIRQSLDESSPRYVSAISVVVRSNWGETFTYNFQSLEDALKFLTAFNEQDDMDTSQGLNLLDKFSTD